MRSSYDLLNGNCQSMVNLVIQRIAYGEEAIAPLPTSSHSIFGSGPPQSYSDYDRLPARPLPSTSQAPPPVVRASSFNPNWTFAAEGQNRLYRPANHVSPPASPPSQQQQYTQQGHVVDLNIPDYVRPEMTVPRFRQQALRDADWASGHSNFIDKGKHSLKATSMEEEWEYWERKKANEQRDWRDWSDPA